MGQAYLTTIAGNMEGPAGARYPKKETGCNSTDQTNLRKRLTNRYNPTEADIHPTDPRSWCLISKMMHSNELVKAAHIIPYSIGDVPAAYLFGVDPEHGYKTIWGGSNDPRKW
ncbi:hypothetical protein H2199_000561 [Coniosporium tulheliwenetii]|uniref:Uncharacterized protein n=1 Tax=Coniosporium tulheliwenetii TaxID=3383036 RepID=A0ACC2ZQJ3_9PEZI|nr:hypothetical protein H2199_000561 [Cladosporium sp. JES 115]